MHCVHKEKCISLFSDSIRENGFPAQYEDILVDLMQKNSILYSEKEDQRGVPIGNGSMMGWRRLQSGD